MASFIGMPWPFPSTSVFESSSTFSNRNSPFVNDVEMEDISEEEAMDYEITSSEDTRDPVAQVRQVEEDEKLATYLQAQYDAEMRFNIGQLANRREQRNFVSSSSRRPQSRRYLSELEDLYLIDIILRTWTPFATEDSYETWLEIAAELGEHSKGLEKQQINGIPTRKFSSLQSADTTTRESSSRDCVVCLCEYENEDELRILPCYHEFHVACIDQWLKSHNTCPICRTEIPKMQRRRQNHREM